jgi:hypothetical protein
MPIPTTTNNQQNFSKIPRFPKGEAGHSTLSKNLSNISNGYKESGEKIIQGAVKINFSRERDRNSSEHSLQILLVAFILIL